jgi:hypothetical protein
MTCLRSAIFAGSLLSAFALSAQTVPPADERDTVMPQAQTSAPTPPAESPAATDNALPPASPESSPATAAPSTAGAPVDVKPSQRGSQFKTVDRLELEGSSITGNRELPKVLYIVPWKKADLGDLIGRPANSLIDEVLAPVDRDVFKRQIEYFATLNGEAGASSAPPPPAAPPAH